MSENNIGDPELINYLNELMRQLPDAIKIMGKYGREYSSADVEYRKAKAIRTAIIKDKGTPVTLIKDLIYEDEDLCMKLKERDQKEALWKTSQEHINALKLEIKVIQSQIDREWANA